MALQQEIDSFDDSLALLASHSGIGASYLNSPESVAIEAKNRGQYIKLQEAFAAQSLFMAVIQERWRFRTIARRTGSYVMPHFGEINWIEIIEPKSKPSNSSVPRIKSVSFYVDDLSGIHTVLQARHLGPTLTEEGVSIRMRGTPREVIFTDVGIGYSIEEYVQNGSAIQVQL